jgi:hypothetical protein
MRTVSLLLFFSLAGCSLVSVEGEIPEVCMGFHNRLIEGVDPGDSYARTFEGDPISALSSFVELDAEITTATATLTARSGVEDLSFLESVTVVMRSAAPAAKSAAIPLVDCGDYACASDSEVSTLTDVPPPGALELVADGPVQIDLVLAGELPEHDWVVDVEVCVSGVARASLAL